MIFFISFLDLVTSKERSVPQLNNFASGFFLSTFFNSKIVFGAKYFLFSFLILIEYTDKDILYLY